MRRRTREESEPAEEVKDLPEVTPEDLIDSVVSGISKDEADRIRQDAIEKAKHTKHSWVQKGRGRLYCGSCPYPHSAYIPKNKSLVGIDDQGLPILKDLQ